MHGQGSQFSCTIHREIPIPIVKHQINPYNLAVRQFWVNRAIPRKFLFALFDAG
jgi:hypothetical protein